MTKLPEGAKSRDTGRNALPDLDPTRRAALSRLITLLGISFLLATLGVACEKPIEQGKDSALQPTGDLPEVQIKDSEQAKTESVPDQLPMGEPNETHPVSA